MTNRAEATFFGNNNSIVIIEEEDKVSVAYSRKSYKSKASSQPIASIITNTTH